MKIFLPRETVSDDAVRLLQIHVSQGQSVAAGDLLFTFESSKSVFDVDAPISGRIQWDQLTTDEFYPVSEAIAAIPSETDAVSPSDANDRAATSPTRGIEQVRSMKADERLAAGEQPTTHAQEYQFLSSRDFDDRREISPVATSQPASQPPQADSDGAGASIKQQLDTLRQQMKTDFQRHVPTGTLLNDRWQLAQQWGFGTDASCYDECLILGDVQIGQQCWIGPFCVLDGAHAKLLIGDRTSIGTGSQIYTHDTIGRTLVGDHVAAHHAATIIGKNCFIAPHVVMAPGTQLGDHCLVATGSYVQGHFPSFSYIGGNPAKRIGTVVITERGFHIQTVAETRSPDSHAMTENPEQQP